MMKFSAPISGYTRLLLIMGACVLLTACWHAKNTKDTKAVTEVTTIVPGGFDLTLRADKDGLFDLDGATLAPEDLRGHLRYLIEEKRPVSHLLLKNGEKNKVKNGHIAALASIAHDLGFEAFVEDAGKVKIIKVEN